MIQQAIVLAAGLGERLRPLTLTCPKPMLIVNHQPLLVHVLAGLQQAGIKDVVIHVSYLSGVIMEHIGDGVDWGLKLNLSYAKSAEPLGTGGGISVSKKFLKNPNQPFLCVNSDIYTDYNYEELTHCEMDHNKRLGHLVLVKNPLENPRGDFDLLTSHNQDLYLSRGAINKARPYTFSGIAVYHPQLIGLSQDPLRVAAGLKYSIIEDIDANIHKFTASVHKGLWSDIGTLERLEAIQRKISC